MSKNIKETDLLENTTTPNAPEIETTDQDLTIGQMYQQLSLPSLGRQIFSVVEMEGPTAAVFNIKKDNSSNKFVLLRNEAEVYPSQTINTGVTQEVIQDLKSQFGKSAQEVVALMLKGLANDDENIKTLEFLETNSKSEPDLSLSDENNAETNIMEISQKVNSLILKANSKNMRTYESYCVLPYMYGASFSALNAYVSGDDNNERGLFLAKIGQTKYYMNPDANSNTVYVGLKDNAIPSKSSAIFGPFVNEIKEALDPDSGELKYFIFNRFSITVSPLNESGNEIMYKFNIS